MPGPEPPSYPTLIGGIVVLAGTLIAFVGFLPGYKRPGWRANAGAVGAFVVGLGTAGSFLGGATHLNRTGYDILNWGLLGLAILLIISILAPYHTPSFGLGEDDHQGEGNNKPADRENAEDDITIYMAACQYRVDDHPDDERADDDIKRWESAPPLSKAHESGCESHSGVDIPQTPTDRGD